MNDENAVPTRRGRPKGSVNKRTIFAREWAEKLGLADPVEFLLKVMNADTVEVTQADSAGKAVLDSDGRPIKQLAVVPLDTRIQAARELLAYMYPRLQATQIQGHVDVPVQVELPTAEILANPALAASLSELALLVASQGINEGPRTDVPGLMDRVIGD